MSRKNRLVESPPYDVEKTIDRLGDNLRTARMRRGMTIEDVAERIGTGPRAVGDAEKGKISTGIAVYAALLWLYDLLDQLDEVAEPSRDTEYEAITGLKSRQRVRKSKGMDNDF